MRILLLAAATAALSFNAQAHNDHHGDQHGHHHGEAHGQHASSDPALHHYQQHAKHLLFQLQQQKGDDIGAQAKELVELSKPLLARFEQQYPQCNEYLAALNNVADTLVDLPLEEIESGYHADGKLPPLPTAECYHAKDLLVHPATVQAMARIGMKQADDWRDAAHEIEEVLEHFTQVQSAIGQVAAQ